jgi:yeast amino acid transporter
MVSLAASRSAGDSLTLHRKHNGRSLDELPFKAAFGVWGSYVCVLISVLALIASFYVALYPVGGPNLQAEYFFQQYLAGPLTLFFYLCWKAYSWFYVPADRPLYTKIKDIDIYSGMRDEQVMLSGLNVSDEERHNSIAALRSQNQKKGFMGHIKAGVRNVI